MATSSVGISATWDGVAFVEVYAMSWNFGGQRQGRGNTFIADAGSVTLSCFGSANTSTANFGYKRTFIASGGGQSYNGDAIWESVSVDPELNGVTRYTVTLKLVN